MTKATFIDHLRSACSATDALLAARISLPDITNRAAIELFIAGDVSSPAAIAVRGQLLTMELVGRFDFEELA